MVPTLLTSTMIATLLASAIIAQTPVTAPAQTITGKFTLIAPRIGMDGDECHGVGGFRDIHGQLPVVVKDASGKILAVGKTAKGKRTNNVSCVFDYSVSDVPKADFYQVQFGRRGGLVRSFDEMVKDRWVVDAVLSPN
jgi:hypothetical protein